MKFACDMELYFSKYYLIRKGWCYEKIIIVVDKFNVINRLWEGG